MRNSEGATLFQGMLQGVKSYPLGQGLQVMAGRPDLVEIELAGRRPRLLGPIDQAIWRNFSAAPGIPADAAAPGASKAPGP